MCRKQIGVFCAFIKLNFMKYRPTDRVTIVAAILLGSMIQVHGQQIKSFSFHPERVVQGATGSILGRAESGVIIPGDSHTDLWVHPELVTIPGNPPGCEFRARTTDRRGRDQHSEFHYFYTADLFHTLQSTEKPAAKSWERISLSAGDFVIQPGSNISILAKLDHTWASAYIYLGGDTILQAFTTQDSARYTVQSYLAIEGEERHTMLHISNSWTIGTGRGLYEPHVAEYKGTLYMTVRAEDGHGYVMVSRDRGKTWDRPVPWKWDNGEVIPMNQTMTKLLAHSDGLALVYTRITDDNQKTFRNRAPLFVADMDPVALHLKKDTERIIVPDKGLPVGNFWVWPVSPTESYVTTAEWPRDGRETNGDIWLVKIYWKNPNRLISETGSEKP